MSDYRNIIWARRGRILTLTLSRPQVLNAFDERLHSELARAFTDAADDPDADVIVLTGAGRAFSAGGDIDWQCGVIDRPEDFEITVKEAKRIVHSMLDCEKPIVAKVNGPAVGLGATVALFCDVIFAARSAFIADPHVNVGMVAGDGAAVIWPQLIGYARAKEFLFTGDRISSDEAMGMGLINHAVDDDQLDAAVDAFTDRLAAQPQKALRWTKLSVNIGLRQLAAATMDASLAYESLTNLSPDHRAAIAAVRERPAPSDNA